MTTALAFTLQPEARYLDFVEPLFPLVDAFEICPETTWRRDRSGKLVANGFHARFAEILERTGKFAIAHGVAFSLGSARPDAARREQWLERIAADAATFRYRWYTDHFGATEIDGMNLTLPLALPHSDEAAACVRASLAAMQSVVPDVGFENSVFYDHASAPAEEPAFIARCLARPRTHLLLDLHNVFTTARNQGIDARRYVAALPLDRVIEVHLSGGTESDPAWLPEGRTIRLDSHDDGVPEEVWRLAEEFVPRCPNLRAVTLERMEGTVGSDDVPKLEGELRRARRLVDAT